MSFAKKRTLVIKNAQCRFSVPKYNIKIPRIETKMPIISYQE